MNITQEILKKFLKSVKMESSAKVGECILNFGSDGLQLKALTAGTSVFMSGTLYKNNFDAYEEIGDVALKNLEELYDIIDRFSKSEKLKLAVQDPFFVIEAKKEFKIKLVNKETIESLPAFPQLDGTSILKLKKEELDEFIKDVNAINAESFKISIKNKQAFFYAKETNECKAIFNGDMLDNEISVKFGKPFIEALKGVEGELIMTFINSNYPIKIQSKTEQYNIVFVIAPMSDDESD